ncbi:MAG: hypothetical protein P4L65_05140 [Legionella sp.]|nr:hypothetical protein [Legionella sp.]
MAHNTSAPRKKTSSVATTSQQATSYSTNGSRESPVLQNPGLLRNARKDQYFFNKPEAPQSKANHLFNEALT